MLLGSVGSCEKGGFISTNAGGTDVLRYGFIRDLTGPRSGTLPDGRIWRVDQLSSEAYNSGYDLKQLFVGAEGTLGNRHRSGLEVALRRISSGTAMIALPNVQAAALLRLFGDQAGNTIEAFEIMSLGQLENVMGHLGRQHTHGDVVSAVRPRRACGISRINWDPAQSLEEILAEAADTR